MRASRREERADHQFRLRGGRRRRRRHAGRPGRSDEAHRHPRLRPELRRLFQRARQGRHHLQPDRGDAGGRKRRPRLRPPHRSHRAIRRHRLCVVQSWQGRGDRLLLRDLHRQRGRPEHGRLPRLHGAGPQHPCRDAVLRGGAQRPQFRRRAGEGAAAWQADYCDQGRDVPVPAPAHPRRIPHRCLVPTPPITRSSNVTV